MLADGPIISHLGEEIIGYNSEESESLMLRYLNVVSDSITLVGECDGATSLLASVTLLTARSQSSVSIWSRFLARFLARSPRLPCPKSAGRPSNRYYHRWLCGSGYWQRESYRSTTRWERPERLWRYRDKSNLLTDCRVQDIQLDRMLWFWSRGVTVWLRRSVVVYIKY